MIPIDVTGIVDVNEAPECPICGQPIYVWESVAWAKTSDVLFLAHYECADIGFFNA